MLVIGGGIAGSKGGGVIADEWRDSDKSDLRKHRDEIVRKLRKGLWDQYKSTNDACYSWLVDYEKALHAGLATSLKTIERAQKKMWRAAVGSLDELDQLLEFLTDGQVFHWRRKLSDAYTEGQRPEASVMRGDYAEMQKKLQSALQNPVSGKKAFCSVSARGAGLVHSLS